MPTLQLSDDQESHLSVRGFHLFKFRYMNIIANKVSQRLSVC